MHEWQLVLVAALIVASAARAEVVATCGAAEGQVYMTDGMATTLWTKDRVSGGSFQLLRSGADDWDIVMTDGAKDTWSFKGAGAKLLGRVVSHDVYVVLAVDPGGAYETYAFYLDSPKPELVWTLARFGTPARKHGLYVAPCKKGA